MRTKWKKYTKEELEPVVKKSMSIAQVLKSLGIKECGGNYKNLKKNLHLFSIDTSHFVGQAWNKDNFSPLSEIKGQSAIKKFVIREVGYSCQICSISEWNGKKLCLELDHIDGNSLNNSRDNLRILCPNCHSQTDTFRNRRGYKE